MITLQTLSREYREKLGLPKDPLITPAIEKAFEAGYIEGFRDLLAQNQEIAAQEHSRKMNLDRVHSFHQEAIKLIERAMKELEE